MDRITTAAAPPSPLPGPADGLRTALLAWYDRHRRRLPWRALPGETPDPYAVLVSELMLQQTTVATVGSRFAPFLARFPTVQRLAAAELDEVLHAWQGLGYYRRARALHACARAVCLQHGGRLPADLAALRALPGLGAYTAAAVAAIAFGQPVVPVDANALRVLMRLAALDGPAAGTRRAVAAMAAALARAERTADFAQGLMELGALVCTPRRPGCLACPWRTACRAHAAGQAESMARAGRRATRPVRSGMAFLLHGPTGEFLVRQRAPDGLLGGMIELPSTPWDRPAPVSQPLSFAPAAADWTVLPGEVIHLFTHFELRMRVAVGDAEASVPGRWVAAADLAGLALPTLTRKLLRHAGIEPPPAPAQAGRRPIARS